MSKDKNPQEESTRDRKPIPDKFKGGRSLNAIWESDKICLIQKAIFNDISRICDAFGGDFQEWKYRSKKKLIKVCSTEKAAINKWIKISVDQGYLLEEVRKTNKGDYSSNGYKLTSKIFDEYEESLLKNCEFKKMDRVGVGANSTLPRGGVGANSTLGVGANSTLGVGANSHPKHNQYEHNQNEHDFFNSVAEQTPANHSEKKELDKKNWKVKSSDEEKESLEIGLTIIQTEIVNSGFINSLKDKNNLISKNLHKRFGVEIMIKLKNHMIDNNINPFSCDEIKIINYIEDHIINNKRTIKEDGVIVLSTKESFEKAKHMLTAPK